LKAAVGVGVDVGVTFELDADADAILGLVDELVLREVLALDNEADAGFDDEDVAAPLGGPLLWNSAYLFFSLSRGRAAFLIPLR
jgi:hypothetical protein